MDIEEIDKGLLAKRYFVPEIEAAVSGILSALASTGFAS
jgi:hypothetical protein